MAAYQYESYRNPYAGSIGELLLRSGDIAAERARTIGQAQARAAELSGAAWGGAAREIGQGVSRAIDTITDPRRQLETQQVEANKRSQLFMGQVNKIVSTLTAMQSDGTRVLDRAKLQRAFAQANIPPSLQEQTFKSLDDVDASIQKFNVTRTDHLADLAHSILSNPHGVTPETLAMGVGLAKANGMATDDQLRPLIEAVGAGANLTDLLTQVRGLSEKYRDATKPSYHAVPEGGTLVETSPGQPAKSIATGTPRPPTGPEMDAAAQALYAKRASGQPLTPQEEANLTGYEARRAGDDTVTIKTIEGGRMVEKVMKKSDALKQGVFQSQPPAQVQITNQIRAEAAAAPEVTAARPNPLTANKLDPKTGMSPNAVYQASLEYALTGKMPSIGFGQSPIAMSIRSSVMNQAGALAAAAGVDVPTLQAEYKANAGALNKLLPIAKATAGFAGTATDNLDLALGQSDQVARTGAKLPNRFLQWVQGNLTPATGLTKFETYIYTAAREYAKVTAGAAMSSQGLTDSAQRETAKLLNAAQSPQAFAAAVEAMKNDMANVTLNQTKQLAGISTTIANFFSAINGFPPQAAPTPTPTAAGPSVGEIRTVNGVNYSWDGRGWTPK